MAVTCPHCGAELVWHERKSSDGPDDLVPGAASICERCAKVGMIEQGPFGLVSRFLTAQEWERLRASEEFMTTLAEAEKRWRNQI